jgi:hypothetical protein
VRIERAAPAPNAIQHDAYTRSVLTRVITRLKGGNDPAGRAPDSLRSVAGSPNRLLTMVHSSDDPADVVRELAVFLPWRERAALAPMTASWCGEVVISLMRLRVQGVGLRLRCWPG